MGRSVAAAARLFQVDASDQRTTEQPAAEWLFDQALRLREALASAGITEGSVQRAVCEAFFFGLAVDFDDAEKTSHRRRLAFERDGRLLLPDDQTFAFHDYAFGVVGEVLGEG